LLSAACGSIKHALRQRSHIRTGGGNKVNQLTSQTLAQLFQPSRRQLFIGCQHHTLLTESAQRKDPKISSHIGRKVLDEIGVNLNG